MSDPADLARLEDLRARGILSEEEFDAARRRVLADLPTGALVLGVDDRGAPDVGAVEVETRPEPPNVHAPPSADLVSDDRAAVEPGDRAAFEPGAQAAREPGDQAAPAPGADALFAPPDQAVVGPGGGPAPGGQGYAAPTAGPAPAAPAAGPAYVAPAARPDYVAPAAVPGRQRAAVSRSAGRSWRVILPTLALLALAVVAFAMVAQEWRQRDRARDMVAAADAALLDGDYAAAIDGYAAARDVWSEVPVRPERELFAQGGTAETAGLALLAAGDAVSAAARFVEAIDRYEAARERYRTSGEDLAIETTALAARIRSSQASEQWALGLERQAAGDTAGAVARLERAAEIEARPEIQAALGAARARLAFEDGQRLLREGDLVGAYERFRAAAELENLPEYAAALRDAGARVAEQARSTLEQGVDALRRRDFRAAVDLLAGIPRTASDAFATAQAPLEEAQRQLDGASASPAGSEAAEGGGSSAGADADAGAGTDGGAAGPSDILGSAQVAALYSLHYAAASEACRLAVESLLTSPFEWTDGLLGRKFPDYAEAMRAPGVVTLVGQELLVLADDGSWRRASYTCDYDTATGTVGAVDVR
jgi:tetratricopeptide (TPR) repeat protein